MCSEKDCHFPGVSTDISSMPMHSKDLQIISPDLKKETGNITEHSDPKSADAMRTYHTGATRDTDQGKLDFEGFTNPFVRLRFAEYMHRHRKQSDGQLRDGDNWQKGMPLGDYLQSLIRHVEELDRWYRRGEVRPKTSRDPQDEEDVACAILFNAAGFLLDRLRRREYAPTYGTRAAESFAIRPDSGLDNKEGSTVSGVADRKEDLPSSRNDQGRDGLPNHPSNWSS